jgi:hypothetical protein
MTRKSNFGPVEITAPTPSQTLASPVTVSGTVSLSNDIVTVSVNSVTVTTVNGTQVTTTVGSARTQITQAAGTNFHTAGFSLDPKQNYAAVARVSGGDSLSVPFSTS